MQEVLDLFDAIDSRKTDATMSDRYILYRNLFEQEIDSNTKDFWDYVRIDDYDRMVRLIKSNFKKCRDYIERMREN